MQRLCMIKNLAGKSEMCLVDLGAEVDCVLYAISVEPISLCVWYGILSTVVEQANMYLYTCRYRAYPVLQACKIMILKKAEHG